MKIDLIILASLISTGIYVSTREGMILYPLVVVYNRIQDRLFGKLFGFIRKPVFDCLYCQGSVYGTLAYIVAERSVSWEIIPIIFATCGLNSIIAEIIRKFWEIKPCRKQKLKH